MYRKEILTEEQLNLLPLIKKFKRKFYLAGGTAIALYIGHRRSIDFDLFSETKINRDILEEHIQKNRQKFKTLHQTTNEWTIFIGSVKITFYKFPHKIESEVSFEDIIRMPSLLTLAAMKAFALGGRAKWKDYVDLYYIFNNYFTFSDVVKKAEDIFDESFNEKLFREQLTYFNDINYEEKVEFISGGPSEEEVKNYLTRTALR